MAIFDHFTGTKGFISALTTNL